MTKDDEKELRVDIARLKDCLKTLSRRTDHIEGSLSSRSVFLASTILGLGGSIIVYAATQSDGWTSQVESIGLAAGGGLAVAIVAAIWMAVFNSR